MIEPLESRVAPASVINVVITPSGVSLIEDKANPGPSTVTLTVASDGDLNITVDAGTTLNVIGSAPLNPGDPFEVSGFSGNILAKLGAGNDNLTITGYVPKSVTLDFGKGPDVNQLTLTDASIGGALTATFYESNDVVTFSGSSVNLYGPVLLKMGDGGNQLVNTTTTSLAATGNFTAVGGKGADTFKMGGSNVAILGKLDLNTGSGSDNAGFAVTGQLTINSGVSLKSGGGSVTTEQVLSAANAVGITGPVLMDVKAGRALQEIVSTAGPVVLGSLIATSGAGDNSSVQVEAKAYLSVTGSVTAKTKNTGATFDIKATDSGGAVGGKLTVGGFEEVIAQFTGAIVGAIKLDLPAAQNGYVFLGTAVADTVPLFLGAVSITAAADDNIMSTSNVIIQGALKVKGSKTGSDQWGFDDTILTAASAIDLGGGTNKFLIETSTVVPKTTQILAPLLLKGGADDDHFTFGGNVANATLRAVAKITIDGGADTDTLTLGANATFITPLVQLNIP